MPFDKTKAEWGSDDNNFYTQNLVSQFHKICYQNNIGVDFIFPEKPDFENYDLVIIPSLYVASDALLEQINDYVKQGGHVILQFKSGFNDENSMVRPQLAPGPLREACGFHYQEFSNIKELPLKGNPFGVEEADNQVHTWAEYLLVDTAETLAYYDKKYLEQYPAITLNSFGEGSLLYEGCMVSDAIQENILLQTLERAELLTADQKLHWPIITKSGINDFGKAIHYYYNYSSEKVTFKYPHANGMELISETPALKEGTFEIQPWDVLIIEEE